MPRNTKGAGGPPKPVALSTLLGVEPVALDTAGAFDAVLNVDSPLFVDPALLRDTDVPELQKSYDKLQSDRRLLDLQTGDN